MKAQLYSFHSSWQLAASRQKVWQVLTAIPFSWQNWWPELSEVHNMTISPGFTGTTFSCTWQSGLGYCLKSDITICELQQLKSVSLDSAGDLWGTVVCNISEKAGRTHIEIDWRVKTTKPWMNYLAPLLKPVFVYSHHAVMRSGERGLQKYLQLSEVSSDFKNI